MGNSGLDRCDSFKVELLIIIKWHITLMYLFILKSLMFLHICSFDDV